VPAPAIAERKKFLCGDGTWNDPEGSKLVVFDMGTVTNSGGSCTHTTVISGVTHDMKPVMIECDNPDAFQSLIHVTTADGAITLTCDEMNGTSDVTVSCMFVANADLLTSSEFDILANRIGSLSDLDTTDKSDLVSAVNEVVGDIATINGNLASISGNMVKYVNIPYSQFSWNASSVAFIKNNVTPASLGLSEIHGFIVNSDTVGDAIWGVSYRNNTLSFYGIVNFSTFSQVSSGYTFKCCAFGK
jgi:hypothetical protein